MILNQSQQQITSCGWKQCRKWDWLDKLQLFIWVCVTPIEQRMTVKWFKWVLKVCPKIHFSHLSKVNYQLNEHWVQNVGRKCISTAIYVKGDDMYQSKGFCQEFRCILSDLNFQLEQSKSENPAHKKPVQGCKICQFIDHVFLYIDTNLWLCG